MEAVEIIPPDGPINATVRPPGSKSITNRALPIAAVAKGTSTLTGVLKSDDTIYMIQALKQLGVEIDDSRLSDIPEESVVEVKGCDGRFPATEADLFLGNSGTSIRFLTAMVAACGRGTYRLDGIERMRERPIGDLVDALKQLGAVVEYEAKEGFPPVRICKGISAGNAVVRGQTSSQFLSGLLMGTGACGSLSQVAVTGGLVSRPYVEMTFYLMDEFQSGTLLLNLSEHTEDERRWFEKETGTSEATFGFEIEGYGYICSDYEIEPDASAASYWIAAATLDPSSTLIVDGLSLTSLQGDVRFALVASDLGANLGIAKHSLRVEGAIRLWGDSVDMSRISDTAQTLACIAPFAATPTTVTGVEHMRHKECDRVSAVVTELRKLGIECDEHQDGYTIYPGTPVCKEPIETYDDHRMAMSFALLGLKVPGIIIKDPDCVNKTYPRFWHDWAKVTGKPVRRFTL